MGLDLGECIRCHKESILISSALGVCVDCICAHFKEVRSHLEKVHAGSRAKFGLPPKPPQAEGGLNCNTCVNGCRIAEGERGYCGVRLNNGGKFAGGRASEGNLSWYFDRLPTNCVADWVCPAGTEAGFPKSLREEKRQDSAHLLGDQRQYECETSGKDGWALFEERGMY